MKDATIVAEKAEGLVGSADWCLRSAADVRDWAVPGGNLRRVVDEFGQLKQAYASLGEAITEMEAALNAGEG